ncbi:MAG: YceI family protein [Bdellovibrionales bacterium]|nr:YceI family protein [Bdellovibrionales bacterium]
MKYFSILIIYFLSLFSHAKNCEFSIENGSQTLTWTAFKTSKKLGVNGTFNDFQVIRITPQKTIDTSIEQWLKNHSFAINVKSVNTKNPQRDKTLFEHFFSLLKTSIEYTPGDKFITGKLKKIDKDKPGLLMAELDINKVKKAIPMTYSYKDNWLELKGHIDLLDFNLNDAHKSLHKSCFELHKGDDGISKTWTDVDLHGKIKINAKCK